MKYISLKDFEEVNVDIDQSTLLLLNYLHIQGPNINPKIPAPGVGGRV